MREEQRDSTKGIYERTESSMSEELKSLSSTILTNTDEEFVGPEYEEDAYYSGGLTATPSFDDLEASDSEEILVHWHHESGEIEEIEPVDFKEDNKGHIRSTRGELRLLRQMLREKSKKLIDFVKGDNVRLFFFIYYWFCLRLRFVYYDLMLFL